MRRRFIVLLLAAWPAFLERAALAQGADLRIFAAASMKNALDAIAADVQRATGTRVSLSYAASSALARQIEQGAPADIFISADLDWMDDLDAKGLLRPGTRFNLVGNRLALIARPDDAVAVDLAQPGALAAALRGGRIAIGEPSSVPAGKYARAALEHLGQWASVSGSLAPAENVRAALLLVARGEAPLGIVYESDRVADPRTRIVALFPEASHKPIVYPAAILRDSRSPAAASFLAALRTPAAAAILRREGFTPLD